MCVLRVVDGGISAGRGAPEGQRNAQAHSPDAMPLGCMKVRQLVPREALSGGDRRGARLGDPVRPGSQGTGWTFGLGGVFAACTSRRVQEWVSISNGGARRKHPKFSGEHTLGKGASRVRASDENVAPLGKHLARTRPPPGAAPTHISRYSWPRPDAPRERVNSGSNATRSAAPRRGSLAARAAPLPRPISRSQKNAPPRPAPPRPPQPPRAPLGKPPPPRVCCLLTCSAQRQAVRAFPARRAPRAPPAAAAARSRRARALRACPSERKRQTRLHSQERRNRAAIRAAARHTRPPQHGPHRRGLRESAAAPFCPGRDGTRSKSRNDAGPPRQVGSSLGTQHEP